MMIGFKRSVRGNIRQSPNVITWITTLQNLKKWGADRPAKCDGIRNLALAHFVFEGSPNLVSRGYHTCDIPGGTCSPI